MNFIILIICLLTQKSSALKKPLHLALINTPFKPSEVALKHVYFAMSQINLMISFLMAGGEMFPYNFVKASFVLGVWVFGCRRG